MYSYQAVWLSLTVLGLKMSSKCSIFEELISSSETVPCCRLANLFHQCPRDLINVFQQNCPTVLLIRERIVTPDFGCITFFSDFH